jgi:TolB protein
MNADGSEAKTLTNNPGLNSRSPAWSHDGQKIAFCRDPGDLVVMNANGTQAVALNQGDQCLSPAWSPDDQYLVFLPTAQIWRIGADGTGLSRLTSHEGGCGVPLYLPDGSGITFHCPNNPADPAERAWIMDVDGGNQRLYDPLPWEGIMHWQWWKN